MRPCKTCGQILDPLGSPRGSKNHERACSKASEAERTHYKRSGHWPKRKAATVAEGAA